MYARGSPNIEMDEHTFWVNRERAVDYLNSLDKVNLINFANANLFFVFIETDFLKILIK